MLKKTIVAIGVMTLVDASLAVASAPDETCNYDPGTGYFTLNGDLHSYGSWEHAKECAGRGLLPDIVANRLGSLGDKEIRAEAAKLRAENKRIRRQRASAGAAGRQGGVGPGSGGNPGAVPVGSMKGATGSPALGEGNSAKTSGLVRKPSTFADPATEKPEEWMK